MQIIPDVVPVSQLRANYKQLFNQIAKGPIILAQWSRPAAVLVSIADWNAREKRLEILEARLKYLEMKRQIGENHLNWSRLMRLNKRWRRSGKVTVNFD